MTLDELTGECWKDLPAIRKRIVGREAVKTILRDTLADIDTGLLTFYKSCGRMNEYERHLLDRFNEKSAARGNDGFVVLSFLLVTIAAAVISWLIQRWLDNHFPKEEIEALKLEVSP